jgi:DDE superfamily endonuclease
VTVTENGRARRIPRLEAIVAAFRGASKWSNTSVLTEVRAYVLPAVGGARQYCGQLDKRANCQAAVTHSLANHHASLPVGYRLYLPKEWAKDEPCRKQAGVPDDLAFETKTAIALGLLGDDVTPQYDAPFGLA